jgi:hypothetical protein
MTTFALDPAMIRRRTRDFITLFGTFGTILTFYPANAVNAQANNFYAGTASGGQAVNLDLGSIRQVSSTSLDFTYYLGNSRVYAQANCQGGFWVSFPERQINRPQSGATQRMLSKVCSYLAGIFN